MKSSCFRNDNDSSERSESSTAFCDEGRHDAEGNEVDSLQLDTEATIASAPAKNNARRNDTADSQRLSINHYSPSATRHLSELDGFSPRLSFAQRRDTMDQYKTKLAVEQLGESVLYNGREKDIRVNGSMILALPSTLHTFALIHPLLYLYPEEDRPMNDLSRFLYSKTVTNVWLPTCLAWIALLLTFSFQAIFSAYLWEIHIIWNGCSIADKWEGIGGLVRIACLTAFIVSVCTDLVESISIAQFFYHIPKWDGSDRKRRECERLQTYLVLKRAIVTDKEGLEIPTNFISGGGVTWYYRLIMLIVLLAKIGSEIFLAIYGSRFLLKEEIPIDLILNTVSLHFINRVDDLIYRFVVGSPFRREIEQFPPLNLTSKYECGDEVELSEQQESTETPDLGVSALGDDEATLQMASTFDAWWYRWQMLVTLCFATAAVFASFRGWCHDYEPYPARSGFCRSSSLAFADGTQKQDGFCSDVFLGELPSLARMPAALIRSPDDGEIIEAGKAFRIEVDVQNLDGGFFSDSGERYLAEPQRLSSDGYVQGHVHVTIQKMDDSNETPPDNKDSEFFQFSEEPYLSGGVFGVKGDNLLTEPGAYRICTLIGSFSHNAIQLPVAERGSQDDCIRVLIKEAEKGQGCATFLEIDDGANVTSSCSENIIGEVPGAGRMPSAILVEPENGQSIVAGSSFRIRVKVKNFDVTSSSDYDEQTQSTYGTHTPEPQRLSHDGFIRGHQYVTVQELAADKRIPDARNYTFFARLDKDTDDEGVLFTEVSQDVFTKPGTKFRICTISTTVANVSLALPVAKRGFQDDCLRFSIVEA